MNTKRNSVAVIGMAGRFPGAADISEFWSNLCNGIECISSLSDNELLNAGVSQADINDSNYVKVSSLLDDFDKFDPAFFKISPLEAEIMDPQIRLLLQCAWETLEDSGYSSRKPQHIGVFAGAGGLPTNYYSNYVNKNSLFEKITTSPAHLGNDKDFLSTYISYKLNLTGPSMTIQTACSTSLVAVHQACLSVLNDECDMALAGGVTIRVPNVQGYHYMEGHIFSKSGHVRTFDEKADGVVFGSGLGLVLLKKLENAIKDGDHIYAVVKGSAILNDGKEKMSYLASSAKGQIKCITNAIKKAKIDTDTIGFIESHGTGTSMGDPEEVKALTAAFKAFTSNKNFCALGAVKTNVGHLEAAAGITGFIKAVLSVYYGIIPPTINYSKPNPRIKFETSPFYVNNTLQKWECDNLRRAGVNSLGVGGTNAFVVLEEYKKQKNNVKKPSVNTVIVPLSAKNQTSLLRSLKRLHDFLKADSEKTIDISDLSYTLQIGRDAMDCRIAFVVTSIDELKENLFKYLEEKIQTSSTIFQQMQENNKKTELIDNDELQKIVEKMFEEHNWYELAKLWVRGQDLDWKYFYKDVKPLKISLPTYSFEKERYWIDSDKFVTKNPVESIIHPLLHYNSSDLRQQSYTSIFNGEEFFLKDHLVQGQKVLPGVAYLEMARCAIKKCLPFVDDSTTIELRDVVWVQPVVVKESNKVIIVLSANETCNNFELIDFEIYNQLNNEEIVNCQGQAVIRRNVEHAKIDLEQLNKQMTLGNFEASFLYPAFAEMGLNYGPAHKAISNVSLGRNQLLAKLKLPSIIETSENDFILHPSIMDGALQATIGIVNDFNHLPTNPSIPFALESIHVISKCTKDMYAWVRYAKDSKPEDKIAKLDIDLFDTEGNISAQMKGFNSRVIKSESTGCLLATQEWIPSQINISPEANKPEFTKKYIILDQLLNVKPDFIQSSIENSRCVVIHSDEKTIDARYCNFAGKCFELLQTILKEKPQGKIFYQIVVVDNKEQELLAGLSGFLKTATIENPDIIGQIIFVDSQITADSLIIQIQHNLNNPYETIVRNENGIRKVKKWKEVMSDQKESKIAFKDQGVYLITGGLGGLGVLFVKEIIRQTKNAKIILTGRSELTIGKKTILNEFPEDQVIYKQMDITDVNQVRNIISAIIKEYKQLNGIIHSAGMISDNYILKKTSEEFKQVLSPKVNGTYVLDEASKDIDLDFLVLFSSLTSALGNYGQADYAAANGFMDQFAAYRNQKVAAKERYGKTVSINWPLWKEGGMQVDNVGQDMLYQTTGIRPMHTQTGIQSFYRCLEQQCELVLVMEGELPKMRSILLNHQIGQNTHSQASQMQISKIDPGNLMEKTEKFICKQFSSVLKLPLNKIDSKVPFEKYGIDSLMSLNLTNQLEKTFGNLSKTLFFEYQTIHELCEYFVKTHFSKLADLFTTEAKDEQITIFSHPINKTIQEDRIITRKRVNQQNFRMKTELNSTNSGTDPIAIVGLSGRYPDSLNIQEYWYNLRDGKDCIVEVPKNRWDWREYFTEDRTANGFHFSKWGGFIDGVDEFDPRFFNITPLEAEQIDPQERLFLQHVWMAIEDAGYTRTSLQIPHEKNLAAQVGVYVGVMYGEYQLFGAESSLQGKRKGFASNLASIANRVSYFLNLHGPSMALDTMCSSSLTAMHIACQDLKQGRTDLAIAGGVNVTIHPNKYLMLSSGQYISRDGHCQSFGEGGDGYIPGEGVGVIILKRLSEAESDGNHIYGIIRGSAINHGGKTNGYTVPNPQAQAGAIIQSLSESKVNPRQISYIEAHGTGTKLGDPIEIAALSNAFSQYTKDTGFCLIGSAKSNIGHCESAAGIAGLTKILLQMKYQQIVPSLHSARLNPHIDFDKTPFIVNQKLRKWERPIIDGQQIPRIAGISSFGAGGSNAHIIVQEYKKSENDDRLTNRSEQYLKTIIPLSARTIDQLKQKTRELLNFIQVSQNEHSTLDIVSIGYTLQTGREPMEERLGFIVSSIDELYEKLKAYDNGEQNIEDFYQGQVKRNKDGMTIISQDDDMIEAINKWIARKKLSKLLDLWVKGLELDWKKLYGENKPKYISLPAYPFARERYWVDISADQSFTPPGLISSRLHPLLHFNTSDFRQQRYSTVLSGKEFYIKDYSLDGEKVLPVGAFLEMARAAVENASGISAKRKILKLTKINCIVPVMVNKESVRLSIGLLPEANGQIVFEIYTESNVGETRIHCQGWAEYVDKDLIENLNLNDIRAITQNETLTSDQCYQTFKKIGIEYGPSFKAISSIQKGNEQVFCKVKLPSDCDASFNEFGLHPSIIESSFQTVIGMMSSAKPGFLKSLDSIEIAGPCSKEMYVCVNHSGQANDVERFNIDLCDDLGNVRVRMLGVEFGNTEFKNASEIHKREIIFLKKGWKPCDLIDKESVPTVVILHNNNSRALAETIKERCKIARLIQDSDVNKESLKEFLMSANAFVDLTGIGEAKFYLKEWILLLQEIVEEKRLKDFCILYITQGLENYQCENVSVNGANKVGLYRMLQAEYSSITSRHIDLDIKETSIISQAESIIQEINCQSKEIEVCYRNNQRYVSLLENVNLDTTKKKNLDANFDVLIITGGTRGLGMVCAKHMINTYGIKKLVLTGRDVIPPEDEWINLANYSHPIQEKIKNIQELKNMGADVLVMSLPLDNLEELEKQCLKVKKTFGKITGVIHAAGLDDRDNPAFIRKSADGIYRVLSPKIDGTYNLMNVLENESLQFVIFFSSVSAIIPSFGNGLSDYAMANAYMDYYAIANDKRIPVVSIQWPSWKETGLGEVKSQAYINSGLLSISNNEGLRILDRVLSNLKDSVVMPLVIEPDKFNLENLLRVSKPAQTQSSSISTDNYKAKKDLGKGNTNTESAIQNWICSLMEIELKLKEGEIDVETSFTDYGVDSILFAQIIAKINKELEIKLDPSIFFEYTTINAVSVWLQANHSEAVSKRFSLKTTEPDLQLKELKPTHVSQVNPFLSAPKTLLDKNRFAIHTRNLSTEKIAVVGMSCRFPGAKNINEYWKLLSQGKIAIGPIPQDCWGIKTDYYAGLIDDVFGFDPNFFLISQEDAQVMDPQALVLLEETLKAIYNSGYTHQEINGKNVGVYIGARSPKSFDIKSLDNARNPILAVGQNYLAANLSQFFNLKGPSLVIDTACSSSLVGMKMAVEAIRSGTIDSAIVGGVSLLTDTTAHEVFARRNLHAADGMFHILDKRASGVVIGEGCGVVYLKPLSDAIRDGDTIYAEIAGISINNDGRTAGPATPNIEAQKEVMNLALRESDCSKENIAYLEVNGSGSEITDLLEIKAIASVYSRMAQTPLYLGSMKPNIGHPLCAEGIASFIKVALMLHYQQLVPFLSGQVPLEHFSIVNSGFDFPRQNQQLTMDYAALNCFADGGTNAHVIIKRCDQRITDIKRTSLVLPAMQRVDVRTFKTLEKKRNLSHIFKKSKVWNQVLTVDHPVLTNHKVYGLELLPGLAWIDLLFQWYEEAGYSYETIELKNLSIYRPLIVTETEPVNLLITTKEVEEGVWNVEVSQASPNQSKDSLEGLYITAEVRLVDPVNFDETIDIIEICAKATNKWDLNAIYQQYRTQDVVHTGMMKADGIVLSTDDAIWVNVQLLDREDCGNYRFHPTLIDGSGIGANVLFNSSFDTNDKQLYLPLFYESFKASKQFGGDCYTRIKKNTVEIKEELQSFTMEFFTSDGIKIGELKNFKNKLVRNSGLINLTSITNEQDATKKNKSTKDTIGKLTSLSFDSMELMLKSIIASQLNVAAEEISENKGYYELGLESAMLLDVVKSIESILSVNLSPILLFEHTTISALSKYLTETYELPNETNLQNVKTVKQITLKRKLVANVNTTHLPINSSLSNTATHPAVMDIAVVGIAGRYPQASNIVEFWNNLKAAKDCITEIPQERWDYGIFDGLKSPSGKPMSRWGGFIDNVDCFDPLFFNISPKEAEVLDPQERLFLEVCWEAIEDAGYTPVNIVKSEGMNKRKPVGVFVGVMHKDYTLLQNEAVYEGQKIPLSLNYAPIANRVSYFCNFHGPSMAVDTVCSSSLTAFHLALESIKKGECLVALAGGVNLSLHPNKYQSYGLSDFHSSDGRCRTFGEGGDGYVSAEGVGAILLKPLQAAINDGDHIYAVVKGSNINHVGKVSGITVPSPIAQGEVIADCIQKCGIDSETISYIEAHGTGTSLGDPIEIQGLKRAFETFTSKTQFCALGSVKSNIGHSEAAAGISGLTKTILQLQHRILVKSLHSEKINGYLDLKSSPFYVQSKTEEWKLPEEPQNKLRRAGVSSFGATGANAHIILEEFPRANNSVQTHNSKGVLLPLSAKNLERLKEYACRLLDFLENNPKTDIRDMAFTLQTGRLAFDERLVIATTSIDDAVMKLKSWLEGRSFSHDILHENIKSSGGISRIFESDEDLQDAVNRLVTKKKMKRLAEFWVKGLELDWNKLYEEEPVQRISLPTYPFAMDRYWIDKTSTHKTITTQAEVIHPLLHNNTSDLSQQRYTTTFTGSEFFIRDHLVNGQMVLPGVAYLEMARVAMDEAMPAAGKSKVLDLQNVVWLQPLIIKENKDVSITLSTTDGMLVDFEIKSVSDDQKTVYCQGQASYSHLVNLNKIEIEKLKAKMQTGIIDTMSIYAAYNKMGIHHGKTLQGIETVYHGDRQLLVQICIPKAIENTSTDYLLHPSLMDSAFQATLGLILDQDNYSNSSILPFAMQSIRIFSECKKDMFAWVRFSKEYKEEDNRSLCYDIDICDESGIVCVQIEGLSSRRLVERFEQKQIVCNDDGESDTNLQSLVPVWKSVQIEDDKRISISGSTKILLLGLNKDLLDWVSKSYPKSFYRQIPEDATIESITSIIKECDFDQLLWIAPDVEKSEKCKDVKIEHIIAQQEIGVISVFRIIKALLSAGFAYKELCWTIITSKTSVVKNNDQIISTHAAVSGLSGSLAKEYPHWNLRLLDVENIQCVAANECFTLPWDKQGNGLAYRSGEWFTQGLAAIETTNNGVCGYKEHGIYVVIGGAGGLGEVWSQFMIEHYKAKIVWIGRKKLNDDISKKINELSSNGSAPVYITADASNLDSLELAYKKIVELYPRIDGVVHSAIVLLDQSLTNMEEKTFRAGLSAKVDVSVNMERVFGKQDLDFMMFFSSVNSFVRGPGQANYAAGCTFKDCFAQSLNVQHKYPVKIMNWGYWGNVGIVADDVHKKRMERLGYGSIGVDEGMNALKMLIDSDVSQMVLIKITHQNPVADLHVQEKIICSPNNEQTMLFQINKDLEMHYSSEQIHALQKALPDKSMESLITEILASTLASLGFFTEDNLSISDFLLGKQTKAHYQRWLSSSITFLQRQNVLNGNRTFTNKVKQLPDLMSEWESAKIVWSSNTDLQAKVNLLDACLKGLSGILNGRQLATDIMFPESSMRLVEGIYKGNVLSAHYNEVLCKVLLEIIKQKIKNDKDCKIRILEIGAGTGGTTAILLPALKEFSDTISEYCYTDLSKAFLMFAEEQYQPKFPALKTAIFDVTKPLASQSIASEYYDVVIATNVLHATPDIRETLRNSKALLKNKGILLLNEMSNWSLFNHMTFGLLEGWWLHTDSVLRINGCPGLADTKWNDVLIEEGFESIWFPANKIHNLGQQIIVASSNGIIRQKVVKNANVKPAAKLVTDYTLEKTIPIKSIPKTSPVTTSGITEQMIQSHVKEALRNCIGSSLKIKSEQIENDRRFSDYGVDSIIAVQLINQINKRLEIILQTTVLFDYSTLDQLAKYIIEEHHQTICDFLQKRDLNVLPEKENEFTIKVEDISRKNSTDHVLEAHTVYTTNSITEQMVLDHVKEVLQLCISTSLKMMPNQIETDHSFSDYGVDSIIAVQLINQINQKLNILLQTTVLFDYSTLEQLVKYIITEHYNIIYQNLLKSQPQSVQENLIADNKKIINRPAIEVNRNRFFKQNEQRNKKIQIISDNSDSAFKYHRVIIERPGEIQDVTIQEAQLQSLEPNKVCVAIRAFSLNFGDLLCVRGLYPTMPPYPFTPGYDASGIVIAVGQSVSKVKVGDTVIVEAGESLGAHATAMICEQSQVTIKPKSMSFVDACALPVVGITMVDAFRKAKLKKGESILIQTAAGGTGLIAVQLAKYYGATIFATAGSKHKLEFLKSLGVSYCINYIKDDFEAEIHRLTKGKGVDVVINTLSGDAIQKGMNCLAPGGRYIEIAMTALKSAKSIDLSTLSNNQSFFSIDMRKLGFMNPETLDSYRKELLSLYGQGVITPTICKTYSFESIHDAYQALSDRNNIGKIVVTIPAEFQVDANRFTESVHANHKEMQNDSIAIIGMSGRFAESESLEEFWQKLKDGKDLIKEVVRWDPSECVSPESIRKNYCTQGSFVDSIDKFDPLFFRISPLEALYMDPQQRVVMEESWKALEDAGYAGKSMDEKLCGVYVGNKGSDYSKLFTDEPPEQSFWGNAGSVIPARIAYYLNLHGPAVSVDTACSSSLVSIHLACQGLWTGEIEMALAGGVFLQSTSEFYQLCNRAGMLSPKGRCHAFDSKADGFVPGEGVGIVVLKKLSDALRDGDDIRGVIVGSGINQDGATNGITAPSARSQERLELSVYERFNINPETIQVVEAHGTGTKLGDPIEYGALTRSFRKYTEKKQFCAIGSVKTNIGHAVSAAGVASVLKILLSLKHHQIPPSLHFEKGNSAIDFDSSPFFVNTELREWDVDGDLKRKAAISSFGFSGTNAHLVIEEAPINKGVDIQSYGYLVVLSALSSEQLKKQVQNLQAHIKQRPDLSMNNLSYTLLVGRMHLSHRFACVVRNQPELIRLLDLWLENGKGNQIYASEIKDSDIREQASLKDYANQRIKECKENVDAVKYLENLAIIADLYSQGYTLDYQSLFSKDSKRIPLPTYPFAKERYWVGVERNVNAKSTNVKTMGMLHPLVHVNTSDFNQQSYASVFNGNEFFLNDHRVKINNTTQKVLPGVAYFEMARAAISLASPEQTMSNILELRNVVWLKPIIVTSEKQVSIALFKDNGNSNNSDLIEYEIYTQEKTTDGHFVENVHCQGQALFVCQSDPVNIDIGHLMQQMKKDIFEAPLLYKKFAEMGLEYGTGQQGITTVFLGKDQLLAQLHLPSKIDNVNNNVNDYVLHPSLVDSALQASICLFLDLNHLPGNPFVPFTLTSLKLFSACTKEMFAWVRFSNNSRTVNESNGQSIVSVDIDLCDRQGIVCLQMRGFVSRILESNVKTNVSKAIINSVVYDDVNENEDDVSFDSIRYKKLIDSVLNNEVSIDEAAEF